MLLYSATVYCIVTREITKMIVMLVVFLIIFQIFSVFLTNLMEFDRHCKANFPELVQLSQIWNSSSCNFHISYSILANLPNWDLIPKLCAVIEKDENVDVVFAVLDGFQKMIKEIPQILNASYAPTKEEPSNSTVGSLIAGVVKTVITEKVIFFS